MNEVGQYWDRPTDYQEWCMFWVGGLLYYLLYPLWLFLSIIWWKADSLFMLAHLKALFLNPWRWRD